MIAIPSLPNLRLVIDLDRPTADDPEGYISMTVTEQGAEKCEDATDGPHDEQTIKNILMDVLSYFSTGHQSGATTWTKQVQEKDQGNDKDGQQR